jgi:hypothetical protein
MENLCSRCCGNHYNLYCMYYKVSENKKLVLENSLAAMANNQYSRCGSKNYKQFEEKNAVQKSSLQTSM